MVLSAQLSRQKPFMIFVGAKGGALGHDFLLGGVVEERADSPSSLVV
jgi:hypothetical protein